jgi:hypothetical protein
VSAGLAAARLAYDWPLALSAGGYERGPAGNGDPEGGVMADLPDSRRLSIGEDGLFRRHDYDVEIMGGSSAAHYISDYTQVGGIKVPTRHRILPRAADGQPSASRSSSR